MRFHVYYEADSEHLLISIWLADTQREQDLPQQWSCERAVSTRCQDSTRLRLSPPSREIQVSIAVHWWQWLFRKGRSLVWTVTPTDSWRLADTIVPRTGLVHLIGIPERHNKKRTDSESNEILERFSTKADWKYRSVSKYIWSRHIWRRDE